MIPKNILEQLEKMFDGRNLLPPEDPKFSRLLLVYDGCYIFLTTEDDPKTKISP